VDRVAVKRTAYLVVLAVVSEWDGICHRSILERIRVDVGRD
jgi:hypothetical protein